MLVFRLNGGFYDFYRRDELRGELDRIPMMPDIVIDLAATTHLDCGSLGLLVSKLRGWRREDPHVRLHLINVSPRLSHIIRLLKLDACFHIDEPPRSRRNTVELRLAGVRKA